MDNTIEICRCSSQEEDSVASESSAVKSKSSRSVWSQLLPHEQVSKAATKAQETTTRIGNMDTVASREPQFVGQRRRSLSKLGGFQVPGNAIEEHTGLNCFLQEMHPIVTGNE